MHVMQLDNGNSQASLARARYKPHNQPYIVAMGECAPWLVQCDNFFGRKTFSLVDKARVATWFDSRTNGFSSLLTCLFYLINNSYSHYSGPPSELYSSPNST